MAQWIGLLVCVLSVGLPGWSLGQDRTYVVLTYDLPNRASGYGTTSFESINEANDIAGTYTQGPAGMLVEDAFPTDIQCPGGAARTSLEGINNANELAGWCVADQGGEFGILRLGSGQLQVLRYPGSIATHAAAVNDGRYVAGSFRDPATGAQRGFLWHQGRFTAFDGLVPTGLTNKGYIIGYTIVAGAIQGVLRTPHGVLKPFVFPGATHTLPLDINEHHQIVGMFEDHNGVQTFIWTPTGFSVFRTQLPGLVRIQLNGINNSGRLVGNVALATGDPQRHYLLGFQAIPLPITPPPPPPHLAVHGMTMRTLAASPGTDAPELALPRLTFRPVHAPCPTGEPALPGLDKVAGWKLCHAG